MFLDIRVGSTDGLTVARESNQRFSDVQIVFTTCFGEYAVEAFEVSAVDYVMKPYSKVRLSQTVDRLIHDEARVPGATVAFERAPLPAGVQERITVWDNGRMVVVAYGDNVLPGQAEGPDNDRHGRQPLHGRVYAAGAGGQTEFVRIPAGPQEFHRQPRTGQGNTALVQ